MAWVRIHDGAMSHPKLVGLIDWKNPFCLWVWGLSYCQTHLTDGLIPKAAVPNPTALKTAARLVAAGTWHEADDAFTVHDYLDHNDSKDFVRKKRAEARDRIANARQRSSRNVRANTSERTSEELRKKFYVDVSVNSSSSSSEREHERKPALDSARDPFLDGAVTERAGRFIERYEALYPQHRKGARYAVKPARDYAAAVTLCTTWPDDRLDKLAVIFLTTDHKFAEEGSRTIPQFLALASWADGKLSEHEARKGTAA